MEGGRRVTVRSVLGASTALTAAAFPVFLIGALSGPMRSELGFGEAALGAVVTGFFIAGAVAALPGGRLVERIGARRALVGGVSLTAAVAVAVALTVTTWWHLMVAAAVGGCALGLVDPGGARLFADRVAGGRQGLAFGVKEASVPAASLTAGAVLPVAAGALGWRPVFLLPVLALPAVWWLVPRTGTGPHAAAPDSPVAPPPVRSARALAVVSVGTALAAAAATSMATFLVPAAVAADISTARAGALLAGGSVLAVATRLMGGQLVDRVTVPPLRLAAVMMVCGAVGLGVLAVAGTSTAAAPPALPVWAVGTALGFAAGWGWTGIMFLAVVRGSRSAPASAAGIVLTGLGIGGALGPLAFGWLAADVSYAAAWWAAAVGAVSGAIVVFAGDHLLTTETVAKGSGQRDNSAGV